MPTRIDRIYSLMQVKLRIDKNNKTNLVEMHMAKPYFKTNGTAAVRTQAKAEKKT